MRFIDAATVAFANVILVAGNHEHHDGIFEDTVPALKRHLAGVPVLDNEAVEIGGVVFFGATLWSDCECRDSAAIDRIRRGMGEYFFTSTRSLDNDGQPALVRFRPVDTIAAHDRALAALSRDASARRGPMVMFPTTRQAFKA